MNLNERVAKAAGAVTSPFDVTSYDFIIELIEAEGFGLNLIISGKYSQATINEEQEDGDRWDIVAANNDDGNPCAALCEAYIKAKEADNG